MKLKLVILFSTVLTSVLSAPHPVPQNAPGPFGVIGNLIQRLQSSFYEGSTSIIQPPVTSPLTGTNETVIVRLSLPSSASSTAATPTITTTTSTATTTTTTPRPVTHPFGSINAILENINRGNINNNNIDNNNNNIFSNPQRNLFDLSLVFTTTTTTPAPAPTTTRSPFGLDGVGQGINAFFQAFIKTNIQNLFRKGQNQQQPLQNEVTATTPRPSFGDLILNSFFPRRQNV
ncbi:unnamed protein product [Orchesella dallaii]|uniref:Uncharacterized protein n=1 Tax=Orchesella dallaii TaxID=48710 RepID=A0ABP1QZY1_9HEXA